MFWKKTPDFSLRAGVRKSGASQAVRHTLLLLTRSVVNKMSKPCETLDTGIATPGHPAATFISVRICSTASIASTNSSSLL